MAEYETGRPEAAAAWGPLASLLLYLALVVVAETVVAFATREGEVYLGMGLHVLLLFVLLIHAAHLAPADPRASRVLAAFALVPLIRILSLGLPFVPFNEVQWMAVIALPLLAGAVAVMYVLGLGPREVYLRLGSLEGLPLQAGVALSGVGLGVVEFFILAPTGPWIPELTLVHLLPAAVALGLASGLAEEIIFRGILQPEAEKVLGIGPGLLFVAALFAVMHIGFLSALDLLFVFGVGLYFGYVVQRTRNLLGVTFAHGLANVALYLVMPFFF